MGQFEEVPIPLVEHPSLDRFVPPDLRGSGSLDELRARLLALSAISIWVWAPLFAGVHLFAGNRLLSLACVICALLMIPLMSILRWTGSFALVGNLLSALVWLTLTFFVCYIGGLESPTMFWYVLAPIPAHIFGSRNGFRVTLTSSFAMPFIFWGLELSGYAFAPIVAGQITHMNWVFSIAGLLVIVPQLFVVNTGLQKWLAVVARRKEEEKREVEAELRDTQQRALEQSQKSVHNLMESSSDGIVTFRRGHILATNAAFRRMLGHTGDDALEGAKLTDLVASDEQTAFLQMLDKIEAGNETSYREFHFVRADDTKLVAEVSGLNGAFDGEAAGFCVFRDVTERKRLQGKMMQLDRMNAVGTLAAGVAHEINNPLAYVHSNTEYLLTMTSKYRKTGTGGGLQDLLSDTELAEALEDIREGTDRIRSIVSDLSTFSKPEQQSTRPLDVGEVLESALKMAENQLRHRAKITTNFNDIPAVEASEANLAQVFLNLLVNAAQAIPEGAAEENEVTITSSFDSDNAQVVVEISDTGPGIPQELRGRIFDPFFSTKGQEEGMGLGLFICRNIVRDHGGDISLESTTGVGTTFRVELAAVEGSAEPSREFESPIVEDGIIGRALIIDDEIGVCRTIERVLSGSYMTTAVTSGREALELLEHDPYFAVVICDLLIPDMSGVEVHQHILEKYPRLEERMVFVTGGTFTERTNEFVASSSRPILVKPFDIKEFREVVDLVAQS